MYVKAARRCVLIVLTTLFCARPAWADTASDLVDKNLAARGGAASLAAIASLEFTGKIVDPGDFKLAYRAVRARTGGLRIEQSVQGLTLVQGYDGNVAWRINPFEGRRDAERLSDDAAKALADEASIDGPLLAARAKGSTVAYLGREDVDGTDAYKLRVTTPGGAQDVYFLDPDTYLEIEVEETRVLRGARRVTLSEFGDYERVDGVYFPFSIETGAADSRPADRQKLLIEHARANVPVDGALFALPAAPAAK